MRRKLPDRKLAPQGAAASSIEPNGGDSVDRLFAVWTANVPEHSLGSSRIFTRIQQLARFFELALERVARKHAIARGDIYVLLALRRSLVPLTPTELFRQLSVTAGAISKRIDRLHAAGFVKRTDDRNDRRSVHIQLTSKGRRVIDEGIIRSDDFVFHAVYELDQSERATLEVLLRRLLILLETEGGQAIGPMGAILSEKNTL